MTSPWASSLIFIDFQNCWQGNAGWLVEDGDERLTRVRDLMIVVLPFEYARKGPPKHPPATVFPELLCSERENPTAKTALPRRDHRMSGASPAAASRDRPHQA